MEWDRSKEDATEWNAADVERTTFFICRYDRWRCQMEAQMQNNGDELIDKILTFATNTFVCNGPTIFKLAKNDELKPYVL